MDKFFTILALTLALGTTGCLVADDVTVDGSGGHVDCKREPYTPGAKCDVIAVCPEQKTKVGGITVLKRPASFSSKGKQCEFMEIREDGSSAWCCE